MNSPILQRFPLIKLSYEKLSHNKVCDIMMVIPYGTKCFFWFTMHNNNPTCFVLKLDRKQQITEMIEYPILNSLDLFHGIGTIIYGTLFTIPSLPTTFFTMENIYYNNGMNITNQNWIQKLLLSKTWLENHIQHIISSEICIGLPIVSYSEFHFQKSIHQCPYLIQHIEYRKYNQYNLSFINKPTHLQNNMTSTFRVMSGIEDDIYYLYFKNLKQSSPLIINIPNYETSIWMNQLFRHIKENDNLDLLEESDDEDEFQNQHPDKYLVQDKMFWIDCYYNGHLKRWIPIIHSETPIEIS